MVAVQYLQISLRSRVLIPRKNLHSLLIKPCYIIETTSVIISKRIFNLMLKREKQMSSTFLRKNAPKMSVWNILDDNDTMMVVHNIKRKTPSSLRHYERFWRNYYHLSFLWKTYLPKLFFFACLYKGMQEIYGFSSTSCFRDFKVNAQVRRKTYSHKSCSDIASRWYIIFV